MHTNSTTQKTGGRRGYRGKADRPHRFTSADVICPTQTADEWADEVGANERPAWYPGESDKDRALRALGLK